MEYERIGKTQTGMISPSKLRMKLMGRKKDGSSSNSCNSSRTSPSKLQDNEFLRNSLLLASENGDFHNEVPPMRMLEDENLDYDSNASSSSFEFHKGERAVHSSLRSFSRPMSSKWNDAEKWLVNRHKIQAAKKNAPHDQVNRFPVVTNMGRVVPDSTSFDHGSVVAARSEDSREDAIGDLSGTESATEDTTVSMRDMGTEMTPMTSLEPSRSTTPGGATTSPMRTSTSSIPSTPRRGEPAPTPTNENGKKELSEEELKLKTRKEIVALGVRLGKMNIAAWASKGEQEKDASSIIELERHGNGKRAAAWEEAEKSKQLAMYKHQEIEIQAWESQKKAQLEAEVRKIEVKVEQMKAQFQAKMVKKIAMARQRSEEKRAAAEARRNRDAERAAAQAEYIRQTGRMPSSYRTVTCCGLLSCHNIY